MRKRDENVFNEVNLKLMNNQMPTEAEEEIFNREMVNSPALYRYIIREHKDEYSLFVFIPQYVWNDSIMEYRSCYEKAVLILCFHDESYVYMKSFKANSPKWRAGAIFHAKPEGDLAGTGL